MSTAKRLSFSATVECVEHGRIVLREDGASPGFAAALVPFVGARNVLVTIQADPAEDFPLVPPSERRR